MVMSTLNEAMVPDAHFLETLFTNQGKARPIFNDILGVYDINHIAISHIDPHHGLQIFSSTPALEFNLFKSNLWRFDKTYQASWYNSCALSSWESLYAAEHYDELHYIKQYKHELSVGLSFAIKTLAGYLIYSLASHSNSIETLDMFANQHDKFYTIGQYCSNLLLPTLA